MAQNAFTLLSLPAVFALSEEKVEEAWRRAIALVHPDKFASRPAAERRVAEVVPEADGLGEILVELERAGDRAREPRDLERVRQARAVMVALRAQEHLRLVFQAAERFRVRDAVDVALEARAHLTRQLGRRAAGGLRAQQAVRADEQRLGGLAFFSWAGHRDPSVST